MKKITQLSRRTFLKGAGNIAIALPFLEIMQPRQAFAQSPIKRFISLHTSFGFRSAAWPNGTTMNLAGTPLEDLSAYQSRILVVKGLNAQFNNPESSVSRGGHGGKYSTVFSGIDMLESSDTNRKFGGPTIDQVIANQIKGSTRKSIELSNLYISPYGDQKIAAEIAGNGLSRMNSPQQFFDTIFKNGSFGTPDLTKTTNNARNKSILDQVFEDLNQLKKKIGKNDQQKIDLHLNNIREIELRLAAPPAQCTKPNSPGATGLLDPNTKSEESYRVRGDLMSELMVLAFVCDLSRVCSFQWGGKDDDDVGFGPHHNLSHNAVGYSVAEHNSRILSTERWYGKRVKNILDKLNNNGMLDHTMLAWFSEVGDNAEGRHGQDDHLVAMFGNVGNYFKTGQSVSLANKPYINRLHLSLLRAYGNNDATFGSGDRSSGGPLTEVKL